MPLLVECTSCGKKYNADESMAGRRIKCRQCGAVFTVPSLSGDDDLNESINALAEMENSQAGESMAHESAAGSYAGQEQPAEEQNADADSSAPRRHVGFTYPYSAVVDRWLPIILAIGGPAWLLTISFKYDQTNSPFLAGVRGAVLLLAYLILLFPLGLKGMQMAGRDTGFALPRDSRWCALTSFMPAFVFGAVLWIIGGTITSLILGVIVGFAFTVGAMFLLFHLDPKDLLPAAGYACGMFAFGLALVGGILFGMNILLSSVMVSEHMTDRLAGSPFAANFSWPAPPQTPPVLARKHPPAPANTPPANQPPSNPAPPSAPAVAENPNPSAPTTPPSPATQEVATAVPAPSDSSATPPKSSTDPFASVNSTEPKPSIFDGKPGNDEIATNTNSPGAPPHLPPNPSSAPPTNSPFVASVQLAPVDAKFDAIIRPAEPSQWVALLRRNADRGEIDRYWSGLAGTDAPAPSDSAAPAGSTGAIKAWTLSGAAPFVFEQAVPNHYVLSADGDLLAHVTAFPSLSVSVYSYNKKAQVQMLKLLDTDGQADVVGFLGNDRLLVHRWMSNNDGFEIWNARDGKNPRMFRTESFEPTGTPLAISPDGSMLAIASRDQPHNGTPGDAALYIHDLGQLGVRKLLISDLDPRWNVSPTGLAFSPDNTKVAVLFEQNANGLLVIFHSKTMVKPVCEYVFNPMPEQSHDFSTSSLIWLNEDALLMYGQTVLRSDTGAPIGDLAIPNITSQHFSQPDLCELGLTNSNGEKQIAMLKLKMDAIEKTAK